MQENSDPLNQEVALHAQLDEKGVSAGARSRAISAIDYLIGGAFGIPAAYVDRWYTKIQAGTAAQEAIQAAENEAALEKLRGDPAFGDRMVEHLIRKQARQHFNREQIAQKAIEYVKETSDEQDIEEGYNISEDWLNIFESYAEKASSEQFHDIWARVLSGEIRKPGAFSLSTIRFIAELDAEIAQMFQDVVVNRLPNGILLKPSELRGRHLLDYTFLEEVGLLQEVNGHLGIDLNKGKDEIYNYRIGSVLLRMKAKNKLRLNLIRITRVGRELSSILPIESDYRIAQQVADHFAPQCEEVTINKITLEHAGQLTFQLLEKRL